MNKYDVILADPPWKWKAWGDGADRNPSYPLMEVSDITAFPIGELASENAALFLWITWPLLFEAEQVLKSWEFTYRTIAWVWVKAKRSGFGHHMGLGYYTRANTEPCLLCVRGRLPVAARDVLAVIYSPVREHSRKPDEQYGKIERLYPDARKLELFARRPREDWDVWGNEVESTIELPQFADVLAESEMRYELSG